MHVVVLRAGESVRDDLEPVLAAREDAVRPAGEVRERVLVGAVEVVEGGKRVIRRRHRRTTCGLRNRCSPDRHHGGDRQVAGRVRRVTPGVEGVVRACGAHRHGRAVDVDGDVLHPGRIGAVGSDDVDREGRADRDAEAVARSVENDLRSVGAGHRFRGVQASSRHGLAGESRVGIDRPEQERLQRVRRCVREHGLGEGGRARDLRSGHRGPVEREVEAAGNRRHDPHARRSEIDRRPAVVRERRQPVLVVGGRHGDERVRRPRGRICRRDFVAVSVVPGGGDEQHALARGVVDCVLECHVRVGAAPGVVRELRAVIRRVQRGADGVRRRARPRCVDELQRHEADVPVDTDDADAVVPGRADRPGDVGAVEVVVGGVVVAVHEVPAAPVVDVAVPVIVHSVRALGTRDRRIGRAAVLARVHPLLAREIGMAEVDAAVDNGDRDVLAPRRHVPGLRGVDVGIDLAAALPGVVQAPQLAERRVVRNRREDRDEMVRLDVLHVRIRGEPSCGGDHLALRDVDERGSNLPEGELLRGARFREHDRLLPLRHALVEADDQLARNERLQLRRRLREGRRRRRDGGHDAGGEDREKTRNAPAARRRRSPAHRGGIGAAATRSTLHGRVPSLDTRQLVTGRTNHPGNGALRLPADPAGWAGP